MSQDEINKINKLIKPFQQLQKFAEPFEKLQEITEPIRLVQQQIDAALSGIKKSFEFLNHVNSISPLFNSPLIKEVEKIQELGQRIKEILEKTPKSLLLLAEYGWYVDFESDFLLPIELAELIEKNKLNELDNFLIEHYSNKFENIINVLCERHPERSKIFKQIESSHKSELYFISIPCMLSQVDGISYDYTKKKFFIKDSNNHHLPQVTKEITKIAKLTFEIFLSPLTNQTPIMADESRLEKFPIKLNRHTIIHGVDKDYGTKINSLKCLSLIKYLSDVLIKIDRESQ